MYCNSSASFPTYRAPSKEVNEEQDHFPLHGDYKRSPLAGLPIMTREETWAMLVALGVVEGKSTQTGWNLHGADLHGADLHGADLHGADLGEGDLSGADLHGADLHGADLTETYLRDANLRGAYLRDANLRLAYLAEASLTRANLSRANLREADLTNATLTASVLTKADLTRANLSGACIDNANISGWVIKDVTCSHIIEAQSGKQIKIGFEPKEFERKYMRIRKTAEVITYPSGGTSMTDLQRLIEKYEKRMVELDAQIAALRHKHDILLEASRLLEEEAQTPDVGNG
jgi:uncharacterized protein YjbI with pentapeptide repeats